MLGTPLIGGKYWRITGGLGFISGFLVSYQDSCSISTPLYSILMQNVSGAGRKINENGKWIWKKCLLNFVLENLFTVPLKWIYIINKLLHHNLDMPNSNFVTPLLET